MFVLQIHLNGVIRWKFTENSPIKFILQQEPYIALLNSLVVYHLLRDRSDILQDYKFNLGISSAEAVLVTDVLGLVLDKEIDLFNAFDWMSEFLPEFLGLLRYVSGQADMALSFNSMRGFEIYELPILKFPSPESMSGAASKSWLRTSAVTIEDIEKTIELVSSNNISQYNIVLLDAIQAFILNDFIKCVLYSAMAMEIVANSVLASVYRRRIDEEGTNAKDLRIISFPVGGGKFNTLDPIYKILENRDDFGLRLHEIPLYLLGRSLWIDNETLYQRAIEIYKARNSIVHEGEAKITKLGREYALSAMSYTLEVFKWFGEGNRYVLPLDEGIFYDSVNLVDKSS